MNSRRYIKHMTFLVVCFFFVFNACKQKQAPSTTATLETPGICIADTIIYPVVIMNPDSLDTWTEQCLSQLERRQFVDQVFDAIYKHKAKAYSYFDHEELSIADVKAIEEQADFSRDKIAKLQFWETWHFDEHQVVMTKQVHAILFAYEILTEEGELRGYKAAFYVKMKE
ncbi:hypothetical protein J1N10_00805 [Carboxylicivirga sp. A043]|uniref:hypothetical protein n=1 Tax=Carboxylicivirga litoralis TaxID=2816963 RepID=UPI0021CB699B|nr:hypothetical protein [Carboxylicivirga sp. A043]MCU4154498.1 hypothetical protein [Carboxylicivirga sp. A043]